MVPRLASALPADEIAFCKWQEYAVYSRIIFGTVQKLRLDAGGSYIIDDEPSTGHEARDRFLVNLGVELRRLKIGEAKRDLLIDFVRLPRNLDFLKTSRRCNFNSAINL